MRLLDGSNHLAERFSLAELSAALHVSVRTLHHSGQTGWPAHRWL